MTSSSRSIRLLAATLALLGLVARPLQAVVDCPMPMERVDAATEVASDVETPAPHHDHHAVATAETDASSPPTESPDAGRERCPDLAHCAVAAPIADRDALASEERVPDEQAVLAYERPSSNITSLEPPPPKTR